MTTHSPRNSAYRKAGSRGRSDIITIDHEPDAAKSAGPRKQFGLRNRARPEASVSRDFFSTPPASAGREPLRRPLRNEYRPVDSNARTPVDDGAFLGFLMTSGLPIRSLMAVLVIAVAVPATFVTITENLPASGIDPMTTASVNRSEGIAINDISMTRIMKTGSSVVSVFGNVENNTTANRPLVPLWITLVDEEGNTVQSWRHRLGRAAIRGGQNFRFMTSAIDYTGRARDVRVSLVPPAR